MKRFHVHVAVDDLAANVRFYSKVFGVPPALQKADYAKWMIEDPRINFAISQRGAKVGVDHLGFQVDSEEELKTLREQLAATDIAALDQPRTECCYARSDKYWITDPQGIAWETYRTHGEIEIFGAERDESSATGAACCMPTPVKIATTIPITSKRSTKCC